MSSIDEARELIRMIYRDTIILVSVNYHASNNFILFYWQGLWHHNEAFLNLLPFVGLSSDYINQLIWETQSDCVLLFVCPLIPLSADCLEQLYAGRMPQVRHRVQNCKIKISSNSI